MMQLVKRGTTREHQLNIHMSDKEMTELLMIRLAKGAKSNQEVIRAALQRAFRETTRRMTQDEVAEARKAAEGLIEQIKQGGSI